MAIYFSGNSYLYFHCVLLAINLFSNVNSVIRSCITMLLGSRKLVLLILFTIAILNLNYIVLG